MIKISAADLNHVPPDSSWDFMESARIETTTGDTFVVTSIFRRQLWPAGMRFAARDEKLPSRVHEFSPESLRGPWILNVFLQETFAPQIRNLKSVKETADLALARIAKTRTKRSPLELLLFDLDGTLILSSDLSDFRGSQFVGPQSATYTRQLLDSLNRSCIILQSGALERIKKTFPDIRIGLFTRAPRHYATTVLGWAYPTFKWDILVCFEDLPRATKPFPDGVFHACRLLAISDIGKVAVIGDDRLDVQAAYQAGSHAVLFTAGWEDDWRRQPGRERTARYGALDLMPDAIANSFTDLMRFIATPAQALPLLEYFDWSGGKPIDLSRPRIDSHRHFLNSKDAKRERRFVDSIALSRYFRRQPSSGMDFSARGSIHAVTRAILQAKDGMPYPDSWVECMAFQLNQTVRSGLWENIVITVIPSRPGQFARMETFLARVSDLFPDPHRRAFLPGALAYRVGVKPNKTLSSDERVTNVVENLYVTLGEAVRRKRVFIIDDVCTSGASFYGATRALQQAGAADVTCIALAKTV